MASKQTAVNLALHPLGEHFTNMELGDYIKALVEKIYEKATEQNCSTQDILKDIDLRNYLKINAKSSDGGMFTMFSLSLLENIFELHERKREDIFSRLSWILAGVHHLICSFCDAHAPHTDTKCGSNNNNYTVFIHGKKKGL